MVYTSHGHHIKGTVLGPRPAKVARCGGPGLCAQCSKEAAKDQSSKSEETTDSE